MKVALISWGEDKRPYSYAIPPSLEDVNVGDKVIIKDRLGNLCVKTVAGMEDFEKKPFQLKPILAMISEEEIAVLEGWAAENT